jgi:hypothetical protein
MAVTVPVRMPVRKEMGNISSHGARNPRALQLVSIALRHPKTDRPGGPQAQVGGRVTRQVGGLARLPLVDIPQRWRVHQLACIRLLGQVHRQLQSTLLQPQQVLQQARRLPPLPLQQR